MVSDFWIPQYVHRVNDSHRQLSSPLCLQLQPSACSDPLLPFPFNISQHDCQNLTHTVHAPQSHSHSKPSDTHMKPTSQSENPEADHAVSCHSAILTMRAMLQRLQRVEEKINQVIATSFLAFSSLTSLITLLLRHLIFNLQNSSFSFLLLLSSYSVLPSPTHCRGKHRQKTLESSIEKA